MKDVKDIRNEFIRLYKKQKKAETLGETIEIIGASFEANRHSIFGKVNVDYVCAEIDWYNSMSPKVSMIDYIPTPKIWLNVADNNGNVHSNYGMLIYSVWNGLQYSKCLTALLDDRNTRRAVMIYTRPEIQYEHNIDGMNDFICTNVVHYKITGNKLNVIVQMRSNDVVFGFKNDLAWQEHVQQKLINKYNKCSGEKIIPGKIIWQVANLHIYKRHYKLLEEEMINGN